MRFDRRDFIRIGAASAASALGWSKRSDGWMEIDSAVTAPSAGHGSLQIEFTGLYLMETRDNAMVVHLLNSEELLLKTHYPEMMVNAAQIDKGATPKPDPSHVVQRGKDTYWIFDLKGMQVTTPSATKYDLAIDETPTGALARPKNSNWNSFSWVADLRKLCGATKIVRTDAFFTDITLQHGHLASAKPDSPVGRYAIWQFTDPQGKKLMRQVLTDKVKYTCPTRGKSLTINVGPKPVVFLPGVSTVVKVNNTVISQVAPQSATSLCPQPCKPNINHFQVFYDLIDAKFKPTAELVQFNPPPKEGLDMLPDYCPGGRT